jgi:crotonobetainyl-CoA:carnitine CoA-transferase CaiB-like acyl-CoA transferase
MALAEPMAFEGIKVLDFTWIAVGPITTKYLADHGATVIRVESVTRPDGARTLPPFKDAQPGINRSQLSANYNTSKYGLGLNMTKPQARELVKRIITQWQPDIIAESFTPNAMRNWGLDYQNVKELKPDIIYLSTCQQGQTGPHASYGGYGPLAAALSGFYNITGWPDREPAGPYGAYSDFINPPNALTAIVAALEYRRRTSEGQHLDLSQYECGAHYLAPAVLDFLVNNRILERKGNQHVEYAPHGVYPCQEAGISSAGSEPARSEAARSGGHWCAIAVTSERDWGALCGVIGNPPWVQDARFSTLAGRKENEEDLNRLLGEWTIQHGAHEVMRLLQESGVPAGVVQSQSDLWVDPQLEQRGFFQWLDHPECGPMPYDGFQFQLSDSPGKMRMPHALIGEHNELILKDFMGLSDDEVADLVIEEVLESS